MSLFHFSDQKWRLPVIDLHFVHMYCSNLRSHSQELAFGTVIETSGHFFLLELSLHLDLMRFFDEVPLVKHAVLAGHDDCVGEGANGRADYGSDEGLQQNSALLLVSFYLFEES